MKKEKKFLEKLNLQLFAEDKDDDQDQDTPPEDNDDNKDKGGEGDSGEEKKEFTQKDLDEIVKKRLARERAKMEKDFEKEKAKEKRLKDLSDEDREVEKLRIEKEELEAERLVLKRRELEMDAKDILIERELPLDFLELILGEDVESTKDNIDKFEKQFKAAVSEEVKKLISTGEVKRSTSKNDKNFGVELGKTSKNNKKEHGFF